MDKPRLLYVEDNHEIRKLVAAILTEWFEVTEAQDGGQGLELALQIHPDVIVTDHIMPGMSGGALIKTLRKKPDFRDMPIVCLSANFSSTEAEEAGADAYFQKPYDFDELAETIQTLVNRRA